MASKMWTLLNTFLLILTCGFILGEIKAYSVAKEELEVQPATEILVTTKGPVGGDTNVKIKEDGAEVLECGYTSPQKILIAIIVIMALLSFVGCFVCCKSLCSEENRSLGNTGFVYQSMTRPAQHHANFHSLEPIPEGRSLSIHDLEQPHPYSATTEVLSSKNGYWQ